MKYTHFSGASSIYIEKTGLSSSTKLLVAENVFLCVACRDGVLCVLAMCGQGDEQAANLNAHLCVRDPERGEIGRAFQEAATTKAAFSKLSSQTNAQN